MASGFHNDCHRGKRALLPNNRTKLIYATTDRATGQTDGRRQTDNEDTAEGGLLIGTASDRRRRLIRRICAAMTRADLPLIGSRGASLPAARPGRGPEPNE